MPPVIPPANEPNVMSWPKAALVAALLAILFNIPKLVLCPNDVPAKADPTPEPIAPPTAPNAIALPKPLNILFPAIAFVAIVVAPETPAPIAAPTRIGANAKSPSDQYKISGYCSSSNQLVILSFYHKPYAPLLEESNFVVLLVV